MSHLPDAQAILAEARDHLTTSGDNKLFISPDRMAVLLAAGAGTVHANLTRSCQGHVTEVRFEGIVFVTVTDMSVEWPPFRIRR